MGWLLCACVALGLSGGTARAESERPLTGNPVALERTADGLYLSARLPLELSASLQDVLYKGVPLHFVWHVDVVRSRWYWWDETVASHRRVVRVAYQPLTRRWRLSVDSGPSEENMGMNALHQTVDSLAQAVAVVARVSSWRLAEASRLPTGRAYRVDFRFYLDDSMLPRPFQIGEGGSGGLRLTFEQQLPVPAVQSGVSDAGPVLPRKAGIDAVLS
ncbi:MAG TPA: DUF4390 domain-containing protein [Macromonas sp.]|nr:DUF4390 domain-containing protein [Macromonas sp.]